MLRLRRFFLAVALWETKALMDTDELARQETSVAFSEDGQNIRVSSIFKEHLCISDCEVLPKP